MRLFYSGTQRRRAGIRARLRGARRISAALYFPEQTSVSQPATIVEVVLAERGYTIEIGTGNLAEADRFVDQRGGASHVALITDDNVVDRHARHVAESLAQHADVDILAIEPGETAKCVDTADVLWQKLLEIGARPPHRGRGRGGRSRRRPGRLHRCTFARGLAFIQIPRRCSRKSTVRSAARWASICPARKI